MSRAPSASEVGGAATGGAPGVPSLLRRALQLALLAAGAALLIGLVRGIGVGRAARDLAGFGWGFAVVIGLELLVDAANTLGWRATFVAGPPVPVTRLFWIRLAGTAFNQLTPTATVGGELVKAALLRPSASTSAAVASLIAARMSYAVGQAVLVLIGLAALLARLEGAPELAWAVVGAFVLTLAGVLGFILLQRRGVFADLVAGAGRFGLPAAPLARLRAGGAALDRHLGVLYRRHPGAFAASVAWHLVGQALGLLQLWCILQWLGAPATLVTCLALEAFAVVVDSAMFLVPARIGVQEGGRVLVFTALGFGAATGLAVALIVRLTQLASAGLGLAAYAVLSLRGP